MAQIDDVIGARVARARQARGLSQSDLNERLAELGLSMTRQTLARIERGPTDGGRPVTVHELLLIALALDVPPLALIAPVEDADATVTVGDSTTMPARALLWWMAGVGPPVAILDDAPTGIEQSPRNYEGTAEPYREALRLGFVRYAWDDAWLRVAVLLEARGHAFLPEPSAAELEQAKRELKYWSKQYAAALHLLSRHGFALGWLSRSTAEVLAQHDGHGDDVAGWADELGIEVREVDA